MIAKSKFCARQGQGEKPITLHVDLGSTTPVLGLTQYFFGFVVLTCKKDKQNSHPKETQTK